jgi:hypothetical protein
MPGTRRMPYHGPPVHVPARPLCPKPSVMSGFRHSPRHARRAHTLQCRWACPFPRRCTRPHLHTVFTSAHRLPFCVRDYNPSGPKTTSLPFVCAHIRGMLQWTSSFHAFPMTRMPPHRRTHAAIQKTRPAFVVISCQYIDETPPPRWLSCLCTFAVTKKAWLWSVSCGWQTPGAYSRSRGSAAQICLEVRHCGRLRRNTCRTTTPASLAYRMCLHRGICRRWILHPASLDPQCTVQVWAQHKSPNHWWQCRRCIADSRRFECHWLWTGINVHAGDVIGAGIVVGHLPQWVRMEGWMATESSLVWGSLSPSFTVCPKRPLQLHVASIFYCIDVVRRYL